MSTTIIAETPTRMHHSNNGNGKSKQAEILAIKVKLIKSAIVETLCDDESLNDPNRLARYLIVQAGQLRDLNSLSLIGGLAL